MVGSQLDVDCELLVLEFRFFFQLVKQDICTSGFCIQLSIYINIESLSDTVKKKAGPGYQVRQIRSWSEFYFFKFSTRIVSWDRNAFFLLALSLKHSWQNFSMMFPNCQTLTLCNVCLWRQNLMHFYALKKISQFLIQG